MGLAFWCCYSPNKAEQRLRLAGFLGTVYAEGWPERVDRVEYPVVNVASQRAGEQPTYALLHPGTPASQVRPEKKLIRPRPSRAAKKRQASGIHGKYGKTAKVTKIATPSFKKHKQAVKNRIRKKQRSARGRGQPNAG
jgi:hypothetical protein